MMVCLPQMVLDRQEYTLVDELVSDVYRSLAAKPRLSRTKSVSLTQFR